MNVTQGLTNQRLAAGDLQDLLKVGNCVLVDVREGWERARGRIRGTRHVPVRALRRESREWTADDLVVLICKSGARSRRAVSMLQKMGFSRVTDLAGGMDSWEAEGLEVERDPAAAGAGAAQMRFVAVLLVLAGIFFSRWWPAAIYLSQFVAIGLVMSLLMKWFGAAMGGAPDRPDTKSPGSDCQGGGGG